MYARVTNIIAQNEMQLTMWIETFKNIGAKIITDVGAVQITITKIAPNKAVLLNVYPNKEVADQAKEAVSENYKQVKEIVKVETNGGEVVFNQNSLSRA